MKGVSEKRRRESEIATEPLHDWRRAGPDAYPRTVLRVLFARVDRRIADLILARARRRWPPLASCHGRASPR